MSLSKEEVIRMARECSDVIKDSRGREAFEFDEYGLERLVNAAYAAGATAEREACEVAVSKVKMPYEKCASSAHAADCTIVEAIRAIRARGNGGEP